MKRILLIAIIIFSNLDVFSQADKGKIIVSIDGNYEKSTTENGVTTNQNVVQGKYLSAGATVGYFITDRFIAGIGLDYNSGKEDRTNEVMINSFFQQEAMNLKSRSFLPNIYFGYYYQIIDKLYINTNLKFSYGKVKSEYNTLLAGSVYYPSNTITEFNDQYSSPYAIGQEKNSKVDFFSTKILPELSYFITPEFSFYLGLGGIEYSLVDWETDNSNWTINFNPTDWRFGIKIKV